MIVDLCEYNTNNVNKNDQNNPYSLITILRMFHLRARLPRKVAVREILLCRVHTNKQLRGAGV